MIEELEDKEFDERSSIKDDIEAKTKEVNLELIEENAENIEVKIIENIMEDSTIVKHEGESITHNSKI
jgi:hypothetical protein